MAPRSLLPFAFVSILLFVASLAAAAQSLTAGDIDDHLNWDPYVDYVERLGQRQSSLPSLSFVERATLIIEDEERKPLGDARVTVSTEAGHATLRSGMDGIVRVLPGVDGLGRAGPATVHVEAPDGTTKQVALDLSDGDVHRIGLATKAPPASALDMMFVIDTTGSMSDELSYLTKEIEGIVADLKAGQGQISIRFGLILYRDDGDEYVVRDLGFTSDLETMRSRLAAQRAAGGGDYPEAMHAALDAAVDAQWRDGAVRLLFLVADAPPHEQDHARFLASAREARHAGIHVHGLAASGVADEAEYLMRAAAVLTQGRYMFLTDDSGIGNAHAEPSIRCYVVTDLNDLLVRVVASEVTGTRVEPDAQDIHRESGEYEKGVCLADAEPDPGPVDQQQSGGGESDASAPGSTMGRTSDDGTAGDVASRDSDESGRGGTAPLAGDGGGDESAETDPATTPGPGLLALLVALGAVVALARTRRPSGTLATTPPRLADLSDETDRKAHAQCEENLRKPLEYAPAASSPACWQCSTGSPDNLNTLQRAGPLASTPPGGVIRDS